jgi:hypothetical protein
VASFEPLAYLLSGVRTDRLLRSPTAATLAASTYGLPLGSGRLSLGGVDGGGGGGGVVLFVSFPPVRRVSLTVSYAAGSPPPGGGGGHRARAGWRV